MNNGLGFFELIPGILSGALGIGSSLIQANTAKEVAKIQAHQQAAQRKVDVQQAQQQAQMVQQQDQVQVTKDVRDQQVAALMAIGVVGASVAFLLVYSALKRK